MSFRDVSPQIREVQLRTEQNSNRKFMEIEIIDENYAEPPKTSIRTDSLLPFSPLKDKQDSLSEAYKSEKELSSEMPIKQLSDVAEKPLDEPSSIKHKSLTPNKPMIEQEPKDGPRSDPIKSKHRSKVSFDVESHIEMESDRKTTDLVENNFCSTCFTEVALRMKHCDACGICIPTFDHHCDFLAVCIGEKNKAIFILFLTLSAAELAFGLYLVVEQVGEYENVEELLFGEWMKILLLIVIGGILKFVLPLLTYMTKLAVLNLTTCRLLNRGRLGGS